MMKKLGLYELSVILFFLIVPCIGIYYEILILNTKLSIYSIALKWFVFSGVGLRLGSAGIKQLINPDFTAKVIFKMKDEQSIAVIKEIGLANICFSVIGLISLFVPSFRLPAAISGGLYFGMAGFLHVFKVKDSSEEFFAMISDLFIFFILLVLVILNLI